MLAHVDIKTKNNAGKHLNLTDYLSKNPIANAEQIANYEKENVNTCVIPLLEFINTHSSIIDEMKASSQTDETSAQQLNNQTQTRSVNKQPFSKTQQNEHKPLQTSQIIVSSETNIESKINQNKMIESIEQMTPSKILYDLLHDGSRLRM